MWLYIYFIILLESDLKCKREWGVVGFSWFWFSVRVFLDRDFKGVGVDLW